MILAAGLSPAWQQIVELQSLRAGEVNRATQVAWCASGKVLNVGLALHHLSSGADDAPLVCATAGGWAGGCLQEEFAGWGIAARWIPSRACTRVCTTILEPASGTATELVQNAGPIDEAELAMFTQACAQEAARARVVVLTGSLPEGAPATLYADLLRGTRGLAIVDAQGPPLLAALEAGPFVVKPNKEELARTLKRDLNTNQSLVEAARELRARGAQWVVVTQGAGPVCVSGPERLLWFHPAPVKIVNPIGSGDCLAAGIAHGLAAGAGVPQCVALGLAAAAENARQRLPARLDRARVLEAATHLAASIHQRLN